MALGIDEKIPLMHVGMKEAITDGVAQEALDDVVTQRLEIKTFRPKRCELLGRGGVHG